MKNLNRGFTLLELMVAIAILAIVISIGAPGLRDILEAGEIRGARDAFVRSVAYARSEAVAKHRETIVCPSLDQKTCAVTSKYEVGAIVFLDKNSNGALDGGTCAPSEDCLMRYIGPLTSGYTLRPGGVALNKVQFNERGELDKSVSDKVFYLCSADADKTADTNHSFTLQISGSGNIGVSKGAAVCP